MGPGILLVTRTADCVVVVTDVVTVVVAATVTTVDEVVRVGATERGGNPEVAGHGRVDAESATALRDLVDKEVVVDRETVVDETNSVAAASVLVMSKNSAKVRQLTSTPVKLPAIPTRLLGSPTVHRKSPKNPEVYAHASLHSVN
ncbi:hypothetical protein QAD02_012803 [Eretmocerus hayati]|uniref:Uncharacterized protein n=1 Tax=Eretmocerus hayati TaxID=131215 RepID=A0ACC2P0S1_9HYME|nr:hypothetical protein QAD02_012803 [Eretmocerus hayati]